MLRQAQQESGDAVRFGSKLVCCGCGEKVTVVNAPAAPHTERGTSPHKERRTSQLETVRQRSNR